MKQIIKKIIVFILIAEAKLVLKKYKPKIVAITGSVGKTSTKDATYTVLSQFFFVRKSAKSFNSEIGVPLTILGCPNGWNNPAQWIKNIFEGLALIFFPNLYPDWLVLEVGVDKPGDMEFITSWLKPDVAVLTRLSKVPVHVEFFKSPQEVMEEKGKLLFAVKPDGVVILNADDEDVLDFKGKISARTILFSMNNEADLKASNYETLYEGEEGSRTPVGLSFRLDYGSKSLPVSIKGTLGEHHVYTVLGALAVGVSQGLNLVELVDALASYDTPPGRMKVLGGIKNSVILDDTYNSSPVALESGLDTLASVDGKRKIAVLGDMLELGKYSTDEHRRIGKHIAKTAKLLVTVGLRARFFAEGALEGKMKEKSIVRFEDSRQAGEYLKKVIKRGDVVLIKGSQSIRMERVTEMLLAEPERAGELLVRQEEDWLKR